MADLPVDDSPALLGFRGHLLDAPAFGQLRSWRDGALLADPATGKIVEVGEFDPLYRRTRERPVHWVDLPPRAVICPGLIDVHAHLPQYPASGLGTGELLPWLRNHIFPLEREFNAQRAQAEAPRFFWELARGGTTTAMLYLTVSDPGSEAVAVAAEKSGLRITLGKMMMDVGSVNDPVEKMVSVSLAQSERLCRRWHGANGGLLSYAFSPRFAVSCSEKLMRGAAELAVRYQAPIQTHLAENRGEIERVKQLFPAAIDYTDVYDRCGLLTPRTVLGHCIHLSDREIAVLAERGSKVAHCPTSNFYLTSGLMPMDRLRTAGIGIGLGSDVAGGPELNLWQVMRSAIETQKARSYYEPNVPLLQPAEAFHLATQGGADVMGVGHAVGTLDPGKEADLLIMDPADLGPYADPGDLLPGELMSLCVYRGHPHATVASYVRGRAVYARPVRVPESTLA